VRSLDDPANPYRGQYGEWDYWVLANGREPTREEWLKDGNGDAASGFIMLSANVNTQGFMQPMLLTYRLSLTPSEERGDDCSSLSFWACGGMDAGLKHRFDQAKVIVEARLMPVVPEWLAKNPPTWATVLPGGLVLTLGGLGERLALNRPDARYFPGWQPFPQGGPYCLYAADGKLLSKTAAGSQWWQLTFPGWEKALGGDGAETFEYRGLIYALDTATGKIAGMFSYDGTRVQLTPGVFPPQLDMFKGWSADEIPLVYEAQRGKLGG